MPRGVMVARRILVPPVRVRILPRQQLINIIADKIGYFHFTHEQYSQSKRNDAYI